MNRYRKLSWKEVSKVNGRKRESCSTIKGGNRRLELVENKVPRIWKHYSEDLSNMNIQEQVEIHACGFNAVQRNDESRIGELK